MKSISILLPVVMLGLLSSIYFLPKSGDMAASAIAMDLPERCGESYLFEKPPSEDEIKLLADDTKFSKANCFRPREGEYDFASGKAIPDRIDLSIVLSGKNLNDSIHRPERCMPAQGHVISRSNSLQLETDEGRTFPVQRLLSVQAIPTDETREHFNKYQCVTYYFFVGHTHITDSHYKRTFLDIKDRLIKGMDQHWAYVSVSMWYGKIPWIEKEVTIVEADQKLQHFIKDLVQEQIDWKMIED